MGGRGPEGYSGLLPLAQAKVVGLAGMFLPGGGLGSGIVARGGGISQ